MTKELKRWCFAVDNDRLVKLVLEGKKQQQHLFIME